MTTDEKFMKAALAQAKKAYALDEVPIGCVIVQNNKIIARGYNRRNTDKNTLAHAGGVDFFRLRSSLKKPESMAEHSSSRTPRVLVSL